MIFRGRWFLVRVVFAPASASALEFARPCACAPPSAPVLARVLAHLRAVGEGEVGAPALPPQREEQAQEALARHVRRLAALVRRHERTTYLLLLPT